MPSQPSRAELFERLQAQQDASPVRGTPATPKTLRYLARLVDTRKLNTQVIDRINSELAAGMTQYQASTWIDLLKPLPRVGGRFV